MAVLELLYSKKFLIILAIVAIFLGIAFYVYSTFIAPKLNPDFVPNKEFVEEGSGSDDPASTNYAEVYFIYANWCPYSKKVKPVMEQLKSEFEGKTINKHVVLFKDIDGEKDEKKITDFEKTYLKNGSKIDGYPSIYIVKDDQVIEFEAKPNIETLKEFIHTVV